MAINDRISLSAIGSLYGVRAVNVFSYVESGTPSPGEHLAVMMDAFVAIILPSWMDAVSSSFTLHCLEARNLSLGMSSPSVLQLSSFNVGTRAAPSLPANRVITISQYSETFTRRGRGRHSFCGIPEEDEADNALNESLYLPMSTLADALIENIGGGIGGEWFPVVRSFAADADYPTVKAEVSPQVRTLRGRTPRLC